MSSRASIWMVSARALAVRTSSGVAHLAAAGALRLAHPEATLEELGQRYADPPMTKDAVAGRIRRLLQLADRTPDPRTTGSTGQRMSGRARTLTTTTPGKDGAP